MKRDWELVLQAASARTMAWITEDDVQEWYYWRQLAGRLEARICDEEDRELEKRITEKLIECYKSE